MAAARDRSSDSRRVTHSGSSMAHSIKYPSPANPSNRNSGYTSFMQPGNSPENYKTTYGSDKLGRNMKTVPKPGGPITMITEGGNFPVPSSKSAGYGKINAAIPKL